MPKKLEEIRKAVQRSGKSKSQAYAIAQATLKRMKKKKGKKK
jgi:DNA-binding Xre family transcriptional regulator